MRTLRIALVCLSASLLSGCIMYRLAELRQAQPTGTPFQTELSKLYMQFAADEEKEYDWFNSWHFADKGLRAAYGKETPPEDLKHWAIKGEARQQLEEARASLVAALTPQAQHDHPGDAANAEFYFDCWVEYQDAGWQKDNIAWCRDNFHTSLAKLRAPAAGSAAEEKPAEKKPVAAPQAEAGAEPAKKKAASAAPAQKPAGQESASYIVFFEKGQPILTQAGGKVLEDVTAALEKSKDYEVVLKDGQGKLAQDRADMVKMLLVNAGIKADAITSAPSGKKVSKRVEIYLNE